MIISRKFDLRGIGVALPKKEVLSSEIEHEIGLPDGWISRRLGIDRRFRAVNETNTSMGVTALQRALEDASLTIEDVDYLIGASATFDYVLPNRSSMIKAEFDGAVEFDFPCVDINTVCTSFVSAVELASHLLQTGDYKNIGVVSSEISSKGLNPDDAKTYGLFGDGAAAAILSATEGQKGAIRFMQRTYSESIDKTIIEGGGNRFHPRDHEYDPEMHSFRMEGKTLLRSANKNIPNFFKKFFLQSNLGWNDIDVIVPHQASKNGMKILYQLPGVPAERIVNSLSQYGNCIAASIPIALHDAIKAGMLERGQTCLIAGTAAGMSITGLLFKY